MKKRTFFFSFPQVIKFIESIDFGNSLFVDKAYSFGSVIIVHN